MDIEKLSEREESIVGAAGHLLECQTMMLDSDGPLKLKYIGEFNKAVRVLRAAIAMHHFIEAQEAAEKRIAEKEGLTT